MIRRREQSRLPIHKNSPPNTPSTFSRKLQKRKLCRRRIIAAIILLAVCLWLISPVLFPPMLLAYFKLSDYAFDKGWISKCQIRKHPLLFVTGPSQASAVWEANCPMKHIKFAYQDREANVTVQQTAEKRWVFTARLDGLSSERTIDYSIASDSASLIEQSFAWIFSNSSSQTSLPIHIAAVGDNQFNSRIFTQISRRISREEPKFLLHVGDAVQTIRNAKQWSTDFYDPLSFSSNLGSKTPLLYARGNHDYDPRNAYIYSGGLPQGRQRGTWHAVSLGSTRWIILDSNDSSESQHKWLEEQLESPDWSTASLKIIVVHIPPFLEYWNPHDWTELGQRYWGMHVRKRWVPLFHRYNATLVISGHEHAYQRGRLLHSRASGLSPLDASPEEHAPVSKHDEGVIYTIIGGAGGTLDKGRVENWGFYEHTDTNDHFHVSITLQTVEDCQRDMIRTVYRVEQKQEKVCLKWRVTSVDGSVLDEFVIMPA